MGQRLGPFSRCLQPLQYCCQRPTFRKTAESSPTPAADSQAARARKEGLARPGPACLRGPWEGDGSGRVGIGARPAQIQDGATRAGSPVSWGPATLVRQEATASPETPSQPPSPGGEGLSEAPVGGREGGTRVGQEAALHH